MMKRSGYPPQFAAAVEAVASTGGQIMPPIMGAAAFVMAEFLGVSYGQVVIWAIIPAVLYYVACSPRCISRPSAAGSGPAAPELPRLGVVLRERGHLFIPGHRHPGRHVFRLQRADGGAGRHSRLSSRSRLLRKSTRTM